MVQRANVISWGQSMGVTKTEKNFPAPPKKECQPKTDERNREESSKTAGGGGGGGAPQTEKKPKRREDQTEDLSGLAPTDALPFPMRKKGNCPSCGSNCFLGGQNKPPRCVQHTVAGSHPGRNPKAYGPAAERLTWQQHCSANQMDPTPALQSGSGLNTTKTVH